MPLATDPNRVIGIKPLHVKKPELLFPTIVTQFTDSWRPKWQPQNVYGRMDPIGFYSGTERQLTLGFRVISDDEAEAAQNMRNIQQLIQYQYPAYRHRGGTVWTLKAPPYFEIRMMNVARSKEAKGLQGYINGPIQINPGFQAKERAQYFNESFDKLYFSDVEIVIQLTVLHEHQVGFYGSEGFGKGYNNYPYNIGAAAPTPDASTAASPTSNSPVNKAGAAVPPTAPATTPRPEEDSAPTIDARGRLLVGGDINGESFGVDLLRNFVGPASHPIGGIGYTNTIMAKVAQLLGPAQADSTDQGGF